MQYTNLLKGQILSTLNYHGLPDFPACVGTLHTFEELVRWLGETDFSPTHSGASAAIEELIRAANTLKPGEALREFAAWTLTQPGSTQQNEEMRAFEQRLVERDTRRIQDMLTAQRRQDAFELASSLASSVAQSVPEYRQCLAKWVLTLQARAKQN